jgi:uncharacterized membrane protein YagU involved in acid resistance
MLFIFGKKNFLRLFVQIFFDFLVFGMSKVKMAYFRQNASKKFKIFFGHLEWSRVQ